MSNTRIITALIAFVATFIFSAGLVRIIFPAPVVKYVYTESPRPIERSVSEMESFLLRDISNGEIRMGYKYGDNADYAEAVMDYWKASSSMDTSGFPQDFRNAWRAHMQAWRNYADYLNESKNNASSESRNESCHLNKEINRTWEEVLRIGRTYGVYGVY